MIDLEINNTLYANKYSGFISNKKTLVSFDDTGNMSSCFFPSMDIYQNLKQSVKYIDFGHDVERITNRNFEIGFKFNQEFNHLIIEYKHKNIAFTEIFGFDKKTGSLLQNVRITRGDAKRLLTYFSWKLKDSPRYQCVACRNNTVLIFKQELVLSLFSDKIRELYIIDPGADSETLTAKLQGILTHTQYSEHGIRKFKICPDLAVTPAETGIDEFLTESFLVSADLSNGDLSCSYSFRDNGSHEAVNPVHSSEYVSFLPTLDKRETNLDDNLETSSLAVLNMLQTDTGAVLASYEQDESYTRSGGYGYCWGRDAAFIAESMLPYSKKFVDNTFEFIFSAQNAHEKMKNTDYLKQRYYSNGHAAPVWGEQHDETGSFLWVYSRFFERYGDTGDLRKRKSKLKRLADFLIQNIDRELYLFNPSIDLWEERFGYHFFSQLACLSGLSRIIRILKDDYDETDYQEIKELLGGVKNSIKRLFFVNGLAVRGIVQRKSGDHKDFSVFIERELLKSYDPASLYYRDYSLSKTVLSRYEMLFKKGFIPDFTPDISNLSMIYPFDILDISNTEKTKNRTFLDTWLRNIDTEIHYRYFNDRYVGGNPWVLSTLWLGIAECKLGLRSEAYGRSKLIKSVENSLGFLPEQVNRNKKPLWIQPLCWSHAFYLILSNCLKQFEDHN